jgi:hypothetical protein
VCYMSMDLGSDLENFPCPEERFNINTIQSTSSNYMLLINAHFFDRIN